MSEKKSKQFRKLKSVECPELSSHVIGADNIDQFIAGIVQKEKTPKLLVIDLFCGAGGTGTGFEQTNGDAIVIACVNHDPIAIKSHWRNYPHVAHFEEDIRTLDLRPLYRLLSYYKRLYPDALVALWASLECTNFSKAKGGLPRDADSRTLAEHLHRYITALNPDYIMIENVVEFMSWGPMRIKCRKLHTDRCDLWVMKDKESGCDVYGMQPISKKNGRDYIKWRNEVNKHGYYDDWKELNSADFGAYTSRNRLFGCFARPYLPIVWPTPTHAKKPEKATLYSSLKKWMAVKEVLNFKDEGKSIFGRKKDLSEKTLQRIYAGLLKYVAGMKHDAFIAKYYSGRPAGKVIPVDGPAGTICTNDGQSLVQAQFLSKQFSGNPDDKNISVDGPAGALTTIDHHALVQPEFLSQYNTGEDWHRNKSVDEPCTTLTTQNSHSLVQPKFLLKYNSTNGKTGVHVPPSIEEPAPTISTQVRMGLVQPEFLANYNHSSKCNSLEDPAPTILTKDKLGLVQAEFLDVIYGNGYPSGTENPAPTLRTKDGLALVQAKYFIDKQYGTTSIQSIEQPAGTVLPSDKHSLIQCVPFIVDPQWGSTRNGSAAKSVDNPCQTLLAAGSPPSLVQPFLMPTNYNNQPTSIEDPAPTITANRKHNYIVNPSHGGCNTSTEAPCPVIVARQDKAPLYLVQAESGDVQVCVYEGDSEYTIKIKEFMALYSIVDIKMRMLKVLELLKIQGFPEGYILEGNQSDQKKFIGNSVVPHVVTAWANALVVRLYEHQQKVA